MTFASTRRWLRSVAAWVLLSAVARAAAEEPAALFAAGRDAAALAACEELLAKAASAKAPADATLVELRARCLFELGRFEEANGALAPLRPPTLEAQLLALRVRIQQRGEAAALASAIDALPLPVDDPRRIGLRVRLALARGRSDEAWREARRLQKVAAEEGESLLLIALALQACERHEEAAAAFDRLDARARDDELHLRREGWRSQAEQQLRARAYGEAASHFAKVAAASDSAEPCARQAICLGFSRQYGPAIAAWETAVARAPNHREYRLRLADLYRSQGRLEEARQAYAPLAAATPPVALAELRLAELDFEEGALAPAQEHAERAALLAPDSGDVAAIRARIAEKTGAAARAIELYRQAVARSPLRFDASYRLARLLARSTEPAQRSEGAALLERYRRCEPWIEEIDLLRQELAADPRQPALLLRMAGLLNLAGEYDLAKGFIVRLEQGAVPSASALVQSGYIHANLGDVASARDRFARALALVEAQGETKAVLRLRDWIGQIDRGEKLPFPLGEMTTPGAARAPDTAPSGGG